MEITAVINAHGHPDVVADTVASVQHYITPKVYVIVDGANVDPFNGVSFPYFVGLPHNFPRAPYRNMLLGMNNVILRHPRSDWYIYMDYDLLVASEGIVTDLARWHSQGVWLAGADHRREQTCDLSFVEKVLKMPISNKQYLLGAFMAFHKDFVARLNQIDFWNRMLMWTNEFQNGFFPSYDEWDISEHLYPSLAASMGGQVRQLAKYDTSCSLWSGDFHRYPVRWQPDIRVEEVLPMASLIHPVKKYDNPLRSFARTRRRNEPKTAWSA